MADQTEKIWGRVNELLNADTAPSDIFVQFEKFRKKLPKLERVYFDDLYEAAIMKFGVVGSE